ncbi:MAG: sulfurtransferase [Flavobacteriaceae bacterium]|nr:MAG: sulfurtransferase [Flavobacteriaceae bacterium]
MEEPLVSIEWLRENFTDPKLILLDASVKNTIKNIETEYPGIQIKNARFFDIKKSFSDQESDLPNTIPAPKAFTEACRKLGINKDSKIVVYDNLGIYSSPRAWCLFHIMGFQNVAVLDGGLPAWVKNGLRTEPKEVKTYPNGNFTATYQSHLVVDKDDVLKNIAEKKALVLDARSKARFYAEVPEPRTGYRSGHIPNSISLPYSTLLNEGMFLPKPELEKVIGKHNLEETPLIFSCGSGMTACIVLLACALVNTNEKSIYDASWAEWGQENGLPISI